MFALAQSDHVVDREHTSPFDITRTKFFQPSHLDARVAAQAGWFSVHSWIKSSGHFARLDRLKDYKQRIARVRISPKHFADLRFGLDRLASTAQPCSRTSTVSPAI